MIEIGRLRAEEALAAVDILRAAAQRLADEGQPLWDPTEFTPEFVLAHIDRGEMFGARGDGLVGLVLLQDEDAQFWPDRPQGEALYLHKLTVRADVRGTGVARMLVEWAEEEAARRGRAFLRLDCDPRPKLCALYEGLGFRFVDEAWVPPYRAARYERAL